MSKVEVVNCDRCGKEIYTSQNKWLSREVMNGHSARIVMWKPEDLRSNSGQRIDLCEDCYQEFLRFLENSK